MKKYIFLLFIIYNFMKNLILIAILSITLFSCSWEKKPNIENTSTWNITNENIQTNSWIIKEDKKEEIVSQTWSVEKISNKLLSNKSPIEIINNYYSFIENRELEKAYNLKINNISLESFKNLYKNTINIEIIDYFEIENNNFLLLIENKENNINNLSYYLVNSKIENNKINNLSSKKISKNIWLKLFKIINYIKNDNNSVFIIYNDGEIDIFYKDEKYERIWYSVGQIEELWNAIWLKSIEENESLSGLPDFGISGLIIKNNFLIINLSHFFGSSYLVFDENYNFSIYEKFENINNHFLLWTFEEYSPSFILNWNEKSIKNLSKIDAFWPFYAFSWDKLFKYKFNNFDYVLSSKYSLINLSSLKEYKIEWIDNISKENKYNIYFGNNSDILIVYKDTENVYDEKVKCSVKSFSIKNNWDNFSIFKNFFSNNAICDYNDYGWALYSITLNWKNIYKN